MKKLIASVLFSALVGAWVLFVTGCTIYAGGAAEVHSKMSVPMVFTQEVNATDIKLTTIKGVETYKAGTIEHKLTIGVFVREATYKDAVVKVRKPEPAN